MKKKSKNEKNKESKKERKKPFFQGKPPRLDVIYLLI